MPSTTTHHTSTVRVVIQRQHVVVGQIGAKRVGVILRGGQRTGEAVRKNML